MPYDPKFEKALRGIAHGWHPTDPSLARIGKGKAQEMLAEAETSIRSAAQRKSGREQRRSLHGREV
jgi:hypothetical protein